MTASAFHHVALIGPFVCLVARRILTLIHEFALSSCSR